MHAASVRILVIGMNATLTILCVSATDSESLKQKVETVLPSRPEIHILAARSIEEVKANSTEIDIMIVGADPPAGALEEVLSHRHVRWVHCAGGTVDPLKVLSFDSVVLTNSNGVLADQLAEFAIAVMLHFTKHIPRLMANKQTKTWDFFVQGIIREKTLLLLGSGSIAAAIVQRAKRGLLMKVVGIDDSVQGIDEVRSISDLQSILPEADVVVLALPSTAEVVLTETELERMKPSAILVNLGQSTQIDEAALSSRLRAGQLAGAGLRVEEQPSEHSPLLECPNVLICPTEIPSEEDEARALAILAKNLEAFEANSFARRSRDE